jgi:RNA polymerase sigma-70 factor (ECF subfamily)
LFYRQLIQISPTLGVQVGYAAALAETEGPQVALGVLDSITSNALAHYQPHWAVRAHLLQSLGKTHEAAEAYDRAVGLSEDPEVRGFLLKKRG